MTATREKSSINNWNLSLNKKIPLLLLLATVPLFAQEPVTHTVNFPAGDAAWTVRIQPLQKSATAPDGSPVREAELVEVVRKGNLRRDTLQWNDGSTSQYWWNLSPAAVMFRAKPSEPIFSIRPGQLGTRRFDESNFSWVGPKTFQKMEVVGGRPLRIYRIKIEHDENVQTFTAGIDEETGLPATWSDEKAVATFKFGEPPSTPLVMPEEYQSEFQRVLQNLAPVKPAGKR